MGSALPSYQPRRAEASESFNRKLRDECLNGEIFYSLHSSLGYRSPAPEAYHPASSTNVIPQSLAVM